MDPPPAKLGFRAKIKKKFKIVDESSKTPENASPILGPSTTTSAASVLQVVRSSDIESSNEAQIPVLELSTLDISADRDGLVSAPAGPASTMTVPEQTLVPVAISIVPSRAVRSPICPDLWGEALGKLEPDEQELVKSLRPMPEVLSSTAQQPLSECMDDILKLTSAAKEDCKQRSYKFKFNGRDIIARDVVAKIVFWLGKFREVGDVAVSFDPIHAALPWAGVRFILQAATAETAQMGSLLLAVEKISCLINRGSVYQKLYKPGIILTQSAMNLNVSMLELYAQVLRLVAICKKLFSKNTLNRTLHAVVNLDEVTMLLADCEKLESQVDIEANNCERVQSHNVNSEHQKLLRSIQEPVVRIDEGVLSLLQKVDAEERQKILDWISKVLYGANHKLVQEKRTPDTCGWLLNHQNYHEWKSESSSNILWLYGTAGTGKTFLTSMVIDNIRETLENHSNQEGFAYFYCNRNEAERRESLSVLRAFIRQLSTISVDTSLIQRDLLSWVKVTRMAADTMSLSDCKRFLLEFANLYPKTTLVLDALDECEDQNRGELIEIFEHIVLEAKSPVKIFLSSRPDGDIKEKLKDRANIGINARQNYDDISKFVKSELVKHRRWTKMSEELQIQIVDTLQEKSQGMFQWAYLQIKQLLELQLPGDIKERLGKLPKDLKTAYDEIWRRIPANEKVLALRAVQWVMCAHMPLKTKLLLSAICQDGESETLKPLDGLDNDLALEFCHNLLIIDDVQRVWVPSHLSVIEYFEAHIVSQSQASCLVTRVCLLVLEETLLFDRKNSWEMEDDRTFNDDDQFWTVQKILADLQGGAEDSLERWSFGPLSLYARHHWPLHAKRIVDRADISRIHIPLQKFLGLPEDSSPAYKLWLEMVEKENTCKSREEILLTSAFKHLWPTHNLSIPRHMACFSFSIFGLGDLIPDWCDSSCVKDDIRRVADTTLLELAVESRSIPTCRSLIKHGADVNGRGGTTYGSALAAAVHTQDIGVVKYLVNEARADVNLQIDHDTFGSALVLATTRGGKEIVEFLVQTGNAVVDLQVKHGRFGTSLVAALCYGETEIVAFLIDKHRAAINLQALHGDFGSALIAAAYTLFAKEFVHLLLEAGADVNLQAKTGNSGSSLIAASSDVDSKVVKLLLEAGADVNMRATVGNYDSALIAASACSKYFGLTTTRLLLEEGADVNTPALIGYYGSALIAAACSSRYDREQSVSLLLEAKADVNMQAAVGDFGSALIAACQVGHRYIVRLLLQAGADVNIQATVGYYGSALIAAAAAADEYEGRESIRLLLEAGADVKTLAEVGRYGSPLIAASLKGEESIRLLLAAGANVDTLAKVGQYGSALIAAATSVCNRVASLCLLLKAGADANLQAKVGTHGSALIAAIMAHPTKYQRDFDRKEVVTILLDAGADVNMQVEIGQFPNALAAARAERDDGVVELLLKHGAKESKIRKVQYR